MTDDNLSVEVYRFIKEREPVEQDEIEAEFGRRGLAAVRDLMIRDKVSYSLDWRLITEY